MLGKSLIKEKAFGKIEAEAGLIDNCKYILYFADGYSLNGYKTVPVRNIKEAKEYLKSAYIYTNVSKSLSRLK